MDKYSGNSSLFPLPSFLLLPICSLLSYSPFLFFLPPPSSSVHPLAYYIPLNSSSVHPLAYSLPPYFLIPPPTSPYSSSLLLPSFHLFQFPKGVVFFPLLLLFVILWSLCYRIKINLEHRCWLWAQVSVQYVSEWCSPFFSCWNKPEATQVNQKTYILVVCIKSYKKRALH